MACSALPGQTTWRGTLSTFCYFRQLLFWQLLTLHADAIEKLEISSLLLKKWPWAGKGEDVLRPNLWQGSNQHCMQCCELHG